MDILNEILKARNKGTAIGHFNISDLATLKAIFEAAHGLNLPVIIGTSEGEREFLGPSQAVVLVKSLREKYNFPIFINADQTHSLEKVKEATEAGYDAIIFDGSKLSWGENVPMLPVADFICPGSKTTQASCLGPPPTRTPPW